MFRASVDPQDTELPLGVFFFSWECVVVKEQLVNTNKTFKVRREDRTRTDHRSSRLA